MQKYGRLITLLMFFCLALPAQAQTTSDDSPQAPSSKPIEPPRFMLRLGASMLAESPISFHDLWELGWRMPFWNDHFEIYLRGSVFRPQTLLGLRYLFVKEGFLQPFAFARAGINYDNKNPEDINSFVLVPNVGAGGGIDLHITRSLGFTVSVQAGYPHLLVPEVSLKVAF